MTQDRMKRLWRPVLAWVFIVWFALLGLTLLGLLLTGKATLEEATSVIIVMLSAGGAITGTYAYKRTSEKLNGVSGDFQSPDQR